MILTTYTMKKITVELTDYYVVFDTDRPLKKIEILNLPKTINYTLQINNLTADKSCISKNNIFDFEEYKHIVDMKPIPHEYKNFIRIPILTEVCVGISAKFMTPDERKMFIDFARIDVAKILCTECQKFEKYDEMPNEKCKMILHGFDYDNDLRSDFVKEVNFDIKYVYDIKLSGLVKSIKCDKKFILCTDQINIESSESGLLTFDNLEENVNGYLMLFPAQYQRKININIPTLYKNNTLDFNNVKKAHIYFLEKVGKNVELLIDSIEL
jgi:hypothetical protein